MVLGCYHLHKILFCQDTRLCPECLRPIINQTYHGHANASENDLTVFMGHTHIHELPRDFSSSVILSDIDSSN